MSEIADFEAFHPRAVKLMRKRKNFLVVAEDEPYFMQVYSLIRDNEVRNGTWSDEDMRIYHSAQHSVQRTATCEHGIPTTSMCPRCGDQWPE